MLVFKQPNCAGGWEAHSQGPHLPRPIPLVGSTPAQSSWFAGSLTPRSSPSTCLSLQFTSLTPCLSTPQAASMAANTHSRQAGCSTSWCPLGPAPRIQDQGYRCSHKHGYSRATGWRAIYLSDKELELVGQNPRARVEVVLLRKQVLHDSQRSAQGNFTHHLRHAWREETP